MAITTRRIMFSAGEISGDEHAAEVIKRLRLQGSFECYGMGGPKMRSAGLNTIVDSNDMAIIGITNILIHFPKIKRIFNTMEKLLYETEPDLLVTVDYPEFNLRLASVAQKLGIKVLIYIAPQVWAWRKGRIKKITRVANHIATILPFEAQYYKKYETPVTYVGHPLIEKIEKSALPHRSINKNPTKYKVLVLPGSRYSEIKFLMPILHQSMDRMRHISTKQKISFHILKSDGIEKNDLQRYLSQSMYHYSVADNSQYSEQEKFEWMSSFDLAISASGTAVLQLALCRIPTVVIYKLSTLNYQVVKRLVNLSFISLPNILCEKEIFPELIQHDANATDIATTALALLTDCSKRQAIRTMLDEVAKRLSVTQGNASDNVVRIINQMITP